MLIIDSLLSASLLVASLNIEFRQPVEPEKAAEIIAWIESTADNVALAYGRFPNPAARIIVISVPASGWYSRSPVPYGQVTRRRFETVELYVNTDMPIESYYADWTATHELSHLMLPLLNRSNRWISEGFATYYQNVLMSRAGHYTPEMAWQRLTEGFARGRNSSPGLSPNEAAAGRVRNARMKVYWSGAALALLADIELRQRSGGKESLDTVLEQLQRCCLPSRRRWSGPRLFARLDSFLDSPVFMPLYRKHANADGFPDVSTVLDELGVETNRQGVSLLSGTRLAEIREAISARH